MAPRDRTTSPVQSAPAATRKAGSRKRSRKKCLTKKSHNKKPEPKLFKPVLNLPYKLSLYQKGRTGVLPEPWLQAAIESGLVEMVLPKEGEPRGGWLEPKPGEKTTMTAEELEQLLHESMAETLKELEELKIK